MRAVTVAQVPGSPEVTEAKVPRPEAGEVLVKVAASSVNGFDLGTVAGYLRDMMEHRFPLILGKDFAGTVEAVGEGVEGFAVGDDVFGVDAKAYLGAGSMAQYVAVPAAIGIAHRPDGVLVRDAGALGLAGTAAFDGLALLGPLEGSTVLISGATGGVGAIAVQLAAARGARVIATAKPGSESGFVSALTDAEVTVIDYTQDMTTQVRVIAPDGVDAVLHLAGDLAELTALTRDGGAIASALTLAPVPEASEDRKLQTAVLRSNPTADTLSTLAGQVASGSLKVSVNAEFDLERAPEAFAAFGAGTVGKIAITVA
ncbi:NADP-dependent oxidoreductase [Streptomyces sp. ISL-22]|uniref:NADP-dependent oxidoreductase n=1 Tax=unclassified Streptomyces TaxID=2593676 RepID=UPI001BE797A6|nr:MULTISPECIES: NADP-dependent oxidoreductase [unclassified Streptomyces]MBT2417334.1 NADP-dependent oxidoreductase [Streptomyces sp. ISL-24]MBT2434630.1 NADP-dependent oxidoreductase [Streptomyces sp. ISL-22]